MSSAINRALCKQSAALMRPCAAKVKALAAQRRLSPLHVAAPAAAQMATSADVPSSSGSSGAAGQKQKRVVFVVGGPGSGKGTQCDLIAKDFNVPFFSAGELIRSLISSGGPEGQKLQSIIMQGQIIPSEVTVGLLQQAMAGASSDTVLIDGFPRNTENRTVWNSQVGYDCEMVLLFDCPDEVMLQRLQGRGQGRADDNEETIKKRVTNFKAQMAPVLEHYSALGKVTTIRTDRPIAEVHAELSALWRERFGSS